jgi:ElaB/YqjD/DUF883 family membrane-anchored ribosome-binding protein
MKAASIEELSIHLRQLLADAEELLAASAGNARESLAEARDHLKGAEEAVSNRARAVDRAVHLNPWPAIVATGVVAFLVGMLVRRR